ncbi:MAG: FAD-binding domain-containing protein [Acidithiobacillus sp.]
MSDIAVVWFKRDLRCADHAPLAAAVRCRAALGLYVLEDEWLEAPEWDPQHWEFIRQSLLELRRALGARGMPLLLRRGAMPAVLAQLRRDYPFTELFSHQETGAAWSYARDRRVAAWCREQGVRWREWPQFGVFRPLARRDGWAAAWEQFMAKPLLAAVDRLPGTAAQLDHGEIPTLRALDRPGARPIPPAGEMAAQQTLESFLSERGSRYLHTLSSPLLAEQGCSRLSAHLAYGTVSMRQVVHRSRQRLRELREQGGVEAVERARHLRGFLSRLHWHCHFIQKLEDEPDIEFHNFSRIYDGLREDDWNEERFSAWAEGRTGFPFVDACMRCLRATGWINFRMRAMLVSFASYHLWLHWRGTGLFLARQFLDFEPGIHWSQMQMQSGTTGINTLRIYSPSKQWADQDPRGEFVRRWLPEWGSADYPPPIVPEQQVARAAREKIWARRRLPEARAQAAQVLRRHGAGADRKRAAKPKSQQKPPPATEQLDLFS